MITLELVFQAQEGDRDAINNLLTLCKPLIAKKISKYPRGIHEDLQQVGMMAVMRALDAFDPDRGSSFSAYAGQAVANAASDAADEMLSLIRVPPRTAQRYAQVLDATADDNDAVDNSTKFNLSKQGFLACKAAKEATIVEHNHMLDRPVEADMPEQILCTSVIEEALIHLEERSELIIRLAWGLKINGQYVQRHSIQEIAAALGLSVRQVKTLKAKATSDLEQHIRAVA